MLDDAHFAAIGDAAPFPMWRADCSGRCTLLDRAWVANDCADLISV